MSEKSWFDVAKEEDCPICHKFHCTCDYEILKLESLEMSEAKQDIKNPPRFQDVNLALVERIAESMSEGWAKYEQDLPPELKNYMNADLRFALGRIGNALKHLHSYNEVILRSLRGSGLGKLAGEDHLGHCAANLNLLAKYEEIGLLPNTRIKFKSKVDE